MHNPSTRPRIRPAGNPPRHNVFQLPILQPLEPRQLLAVQWPLNINFQPAAAPVPAGYLADTGEVYATRSSGLVYGWDQPTASATRDRNSAASPDQRYDTLVHTQLYGTRKWEVAVPSGRYTVRLVGGDPTYSDIVCRYNVEGILALSGTSSSATHWFDNTITLDVTDGRLTVTNGQGAQNNKLDFIEINPAGTSTTQSPFAATPHVPGQIEAENFDNGGESIAFHDSDSINSGGAYRNTAVDLAAATDTNAGYFLGWTRAGEWTEYTVNVDAAGTYNLDLRVASAGAGTFHLDFDGVNKTGSISMPNTGGWQSWRTITRSNISLSAGAHVMRLAFDSGSAIGNINWMRLSSTPTQTGWTTAAPNPQRRFEANNAAVNGKLYVFGGYDIYINAFKRSDAYNPTTNTWTRIADMPEALTHSGTAVDGNIIYIAGGFVGSHNTTATSHVWKYNTATNTWSAGVSLPHARAAGGLVRVGRTLHFFGGANGGQTTDFADHWTFNLDGGTFWSSAPAMPTKRNHFGYAELAGKIYAIGGQLLEDEAHGNLAEVDVFDPSTNSWSRAADLPTARSHTHTSTFLYNGKLGIAGGQKNGTTGPVTTAEVLLFDPLANNWSPLPSLPEPRQAAVAQVINAELFLTTGTPTGVNPQTTTWKLQLS